jgi:hypothetical protein
MSTELRDVPGTDILQTRFHGGEKRGSCIQITQSFSGVTADWSPIKRSNLVQLTREEARLVAQELLLFAEGLEVVAPYEDSL